MSLSALTKQLIDALCTLPGVGQKTGQRLAFQLLSDSGRQNGLLLAETLRQALEQVGHCQTCRNFSETPQCPLCQNDKRPKHQLCVVESPADLMAIEQTHRYNGRYFVLHGHLSPLEGIGPEQLGIDELIQTIQQQAVEEVILATNSTMEGEATAQFISAQIKNPDVRLSRIAHGVPIGGELEYLDGSTLGHAFAGRVNINRQPQEH